MAAPRPATREALARRIDRVLAHLGGALDGELSLDRLAEVASLSRFHFHRSYRALLGETVAETVRRLRLTRAAGALVQGRRPIAEIARSAGYGSVAAFTRAFAAAYGQPPAAYRKAGRLVPPADPAPADPARPYEVRLERQPPLTLLGLPHRGPYIELGAAFERLFAWAGARGLLRPDTRSVGLYWDDPAAVPARELRSAACISLPDTAATLAGPAGSERHALPGGRMAVARHQGPYGELEAAYDWLYRSWLPASGLEPADHPCFEIYLNDPRQVAPAALLTDVCLPLAG